MGSCGVGNDLATGTTTTLGAGKFKFYLSRRNGKFQSHNQLLKSITRVETLYHSTYHQWMDHHQTLNAWDPPEYRQHLQHPEGWLCFITASGTSRGQCCSLLELNLLENRVHFFLFPGDSLMQIEALCHEQSQNRWPLHLSATVSWVFLSEGYEL